MQWMNTEQRYGIMSKIFHWFMFIAIVGAMIGGNIDGAMPDGPEKAEALLMHKGFGVLILMVGLSRLLWRLLNPRPRLDDGIVPWQRKASEAAHWLLYLLFIAQPVSGILMTQSAGYPVSFFGVFDVPTLVGESEQMAGVFHEAHEIIWILLATLASVHVLAALKHHFIDKNNVLRRMLNG